MRPLLAAALVGVLLAVGVTGVDIALAGVIHDAQPQGSCIVPADLEHLCS